MNFGLSLSLIGLIVARYFVHEKNVPPPTASSVGSYSICSTQYPTPEVMTSRSQIQEERKKKRRKETARKLPQSMSIPVCCNSHTHPSHCKIHVKAGLEPVQKVQRIMGILHPKHWRTPTVNSTDTRNMSIQGTFPTACFIRRKPPLRRRSVWSLFPSDIVSHD